MLATLRPGEVIVIVITFIVLAGLGALTLRRLGGRRR